MTGVKRGGLSKNTGISYWLRKYKLFSTLPSRATAISGCNSRDITILSLILRQSYDICKFWGFNRPFVRNALNLAHGKKGTKKRDKFPQTSSLVSSPVTVPIKSWSPMYPTFITSLDSSFSVSSKFFMIILL